MAIKFYRYKIVETDLTPSEQELDRLGDEGWKLIGIKSRYINSALAREAVGFNMFFMKECIML